MKPAQSACYVRDTGLFTLLDKKFLKTIARKSRVFNLVRKRGASEEFPIDDKVYIIHEGIVFLSCIDVNGKKIILDILSPGSIFGDLDFNDENGFTNECLFIEPVGEANICEMGKEDFKQILYQNPQFAVSLLSSMSNQLISLEQKVGTLVFSDVEARLISQFISLAEQHGNIDNDTLKINIKLTHEKLSEMIGSARETVSESISILRSKGIIKQDKNGKYIIYKKRLREVFSDPSGELGS